MQKETMKFASSVILEGMTSIRAVLSGREAGINDRRILEIRFDRAREEKIKRELGYLRAISAQQGFSVVASDAQSIDAMTLGTTHGGLVAVCSDRTLPCLCRETAVAQIVPKGFYAMIEGIEDPYNFGYSLRSLYACGCDGILVPKRNWFSAAGVVARSSAGASELFPAFMAESSSDVIDIFHAMGYTVVCADEKTDHVLGQCEMKKPLLLVVGGEKRGLSAPVLAAADLRVKIAYARPFRASLSAASATTMFAYEIARQNTDT